MPSRRKQIELDDNEIGDYLDAQKTLIIVSNGHNGYPHPMPMWFARDDDGTIRCTTFSKSQKVLNWRRDPKADPARRERRRVRRAKECRDLRQL